MYKYMNICTHIHIYIHRQFNPKSYNVIHLPDPGGAVTIALHCASGSLFERKNVVAIQISYHIVHCNKSRKNVCMRINMFTEPEMYLTSFDYTFVRNIFLFIWRGCNRNRSDIYLAL